MSGRFAALVEVDGEMYAVGAFLDRNTVGGVGDALEAIVPGATMRGTVRLISEREAFAEWVRIAPDGG